MNIQEDSLDQDVEKLVKELEPLIQQMKIINNQAVVAYTPLIDDLCRRKAPQNEVELMLDYLLMFAGDDRMLALYKRVCRAYWQTGQYPIDVTFHDLEHLYISHLERDDLESIDTSFRERARVELGDDFCSPSLSQSPPTCPL